MYEGGRASRSASLFLRSALNSTRGRSRIDARDTAGPRDVDVQGHTAPGVRDGQPHTSEVCSPRALRGEGEAVNGGLESPVKLKQVS